MYTKLILDEDDFMFTDSGSLHAELSILRKLTILFYTAALGGLLFLMTFASEAFRFKGRPN